MSDANAPSSADAAAPAPATEARVTTKPEDFLKAIVGQTVVVKLSSGAQYRGHLASLDGFMNIALADTEEIGKTSTTVLGDCFFRGNSGNWPRCFSLMPRMMRVRRIHFLGILTEA
ncbi:hypothetical protein CAUPRSCDRAFT_8951 [Caulochytrium protostelioides]|uniref:Sm domain-containing protein n=1 Tax=Caulochytrium protostelioides TaxID=1555241 RepID=A0A4P9WSQ0_9FUNG|nr:hypothetical protein CAUPRSCDRAFT_8951 [Caulochytrium protostelioides]